jgi:hypothetical protein
MNKPPGAPVILHKNLTVLITDDPMLFAEVKADPKVGPLLLAQLSPEVGVSLPQNGEQVNRQLVKSGHLPKVVG